MYNFSIYFTSSTGNMYAITPYLGSNGYHVDVYDPSTDDYSAWEGCERFPQFLYNNCLNGTDHEVCTEKRTKLSNKQACRILEYLISKVNVNQHN